MSDSRNNPVGWFEIYVQDMGRAKAFYESVLGTQFTKLENPGIRDPEWNYGPSHAAERQWRALAQMSGFDSDANRVLVYFGCADRAVEAAKAEKAGGRIQNPKMSMGPYGHIALVFDTEGNMVGLHSMR